MSELNPVERRDAITLHIGEPLAWAVGLMREDSPTDDPLLVGLESASRSFVGKSFLFHDAGSGA